MEPLYLAPHCSIWNSEGRNGGEKVLCQGAGSLPGEGVKEEEEGRVRAERESLGLSCAEVPGSYSWLSINPLPCLGQVSRLGEKIGLRNPEAPQVFPAAPSGSADHVRCLPSLVQPDAQSWPPPTLPPLPWQGHPFPTPCPFTQALPTVSWQYASQRPGSRGAGGEK